MSRRWMVSILSSFGVALFATGCQDGSRRLSENATIEAEAASSQAIAAENANLAAKAAAMEEDLARRQRFYQALSGIFEGAVGGPVEGKVPDGARRVRWIVSARPPVVRPDRVRTLEEIAADLSELYVNVQVTQWDEETGAASGCVFEDVRPDLGTGSLSLVSEACPYTYFVAIAPADPSSILDGKISAVDRLTGARYSTLTAADDELDLARVAEASGDVIPGQGSVGEVQAKSIAAMERDLVERKALVESLGGRYVAERVDALGRPARVELEILPKTTSYVGDRVRTEAEIVADLSSLRLSVRATERVPGTEMLASCAFEDLEVNPVTKTVALVSASCPYSYAIARDAENGNLAVHRSSGVDGTELDLVARLAQAPFAAGGMGAALDEWTERRTVELERDLGRRFRFFEAVRGVFEGTLQGAGAGLPTYSVRIELVPSITPVPSGGRRRTIEELTADIQNLSFKAMVLHWNPAQPGFANVSCRVEEIRPDFARGVIPIASRDCPNFYELRIASREESSKESVTVAGEDLAKALFYSEGLSALPSIDRLIGRVQSGTQPKPFDLVADRVVVSP